MTHGDACPQGCQHRSSVGPRTCLSSESPDDAGATGPRTHGKKCRWRLSSVRAGTVSLTCVRTPCAVSGHKYVFSKCDRHLDPLAFIQCRPCARNCSRHEGPSVNAPKMGLCSDFHSVGQMGRSMFTTMIRSMKKLKADGGQTVGVGGDCRPVSREGLSEKMFVEQ